MVTAGIHVHANVCWVSKESDTMGGETLASLPMTPTAGTCKVKKKISGFSAKKWCGQVAFYFILGGMAHRNHAHLLPTHVPHAQIKVYLKVTGIKFCQVLV